MRESNRYAKYKPVNAKAESRDICPDDALTLNDVPEIHAKGKYRGVIDEYLGKTSGLQDRNAESYQIESLVEADELVRACNFAIKNQSHPEATKKAIYRVKHEAKEIARGLRAAVDELETTRDYPESRRDSDTSRSTPANRPDWLDERVRTDGGTKQDTFGTATVQATTRGTCDHVMRVYNGVKEKCGNSARWRVDYTDGDFRHYCGVHQGDIEVLLR